SLLQHAARLAFEHKQWPLAIQWLNRILQIKPRSRKTMMRLGAALIQSGYTQQGLPLLHECKRWGMQDAAIELHLGIAYRAQKHFSEAQTAFQQAAQLSPDNPDILYWKALSDYENGEYYDAEQGCQKLLRQNKNHLDGTILLAQILNRSGEYQQALDLLFAAKNRVKRRKNIRRDALLIRFLKEWGRACLALDRGEEAYEAAAELIEQDPSDPEARDLMAQSCIQTERFQESFLYLTAGPGGVDPS
ncbi:MAG: tetratricopeptide repeat protein, partial [Candidatus Hinthialibacter sp.]